MHLVIPFANPPSPGAPAGAPSGAVHGASARRMPHLPHLQALLAHGERAESSPEAQPEGGEPMLTLSMPHERVLAEALGLPGGDGTLPWAAWHARQAGIVAPQPGSAWGLLTPCHWSLGTERLTMLDPASLGLDEEASRSLLGAVRSLFEEEGIAIEYLGPHAWLIHHPELEGLRCASPDRVIARNVDLWLPADRAARRLRRLQSEVQMLLHTHPLNAQREARGERAVNSVWLSGCGALPPDWAPGPAPRADERLRAPALAGDSQAWCAAFEALDASLLAEALAAVRAGRRLRLTLCGEARARSWTLARRPAWRRWLAGRGPALETALDGL